MPPDPTAVGVSVGLAILLWVPTLALCLLLACWPSTPRGDIATEQARRWTRRWKSLFLALLVLHMVALAISIALGPVKNEALIGTFVNTYFWIAVLLGESFLG